MRSPIEDAALVARCKAELPHQHHAFEQLIERYKDMVFTLCYRMTGNRTDAEDLLQEILTRVFLNLQKFDGRAAFSSWLYRVAHNHCLNFLAKRKLEYARTSALPEGDVVPDSGSEPTRQDEATMAALASLEPEERSLLIMKYVIDLDVREIAEILKIGVSATKMRLARTREKFKQLLEGTR